MNTRVFLSVLQQDLLKEWKYGIGYGNAGMMPIRLFFIEKACNLFTIMQLRQENFVPLYGFN